MRRRLAGSACPALACFGFPQGARTQQRVKWVRRRRMMMGNGPPSSTLGALAYIARHEGVGALYNGIWLTWVRPPGQLLSMAGARQRRACAPASARVKRPAHAPRSRAHRGGHAGIQDRWFDDVAGGAGAAVGPDTAPQLRCLGECAQIKQAPQYAVTFLVYDLTKKALAVDNGAPPRARPAEPEPPTAARRASNSDAAARRLEHWQGLLSA